MSNCLDLDDIFDDSVIVPEVKKTNEEYYRLGPGGIPRPFFSTSNFKPCLDRLRAQRQKRKIKENFPEFTKYVSAKYHAPLKPDVTLPVKRSKPKVEKSLYDILRVEVDSSEDAIRSSFRKLSTKLHPDKGGSTSEFCELKRAYEVLSNDELRRVYDNEGLKAVEAFLGF